MLNLRISPDLQEEFPDITLNVQSLEVVKTLCYFGGALGNREDSVDSVLARVKSAWITLRVS